MAIGMIELQGGIQRTQDFSILKHNEDIKTHVDQNNLQIQADKTSEQNANRIVRSDDSSKSEGKADAREKGGGTYAGDGGKNRKKQEVPTEGRVVVKGRSHFDMSV